MKNSIRMAGTQFSAQRMLMDYTNYFYIGAVNAARSLRANDFQITREVTAWLDRISESWNNIVIKEINMPELGQTVQVGQHIPVSLQVSLGELTPEDVAVEIVAGRLNSQEQFTDFEPAVAELNGSGQETGGVYTYHGEVTCHETGRLGVTARVVPRNEHLIHNRKPKLISWW